MSFYQQKIMSHYKMPCCKGRLDSYTLRFEGKNPLCGDEVVIYLQLDKKKRIKEVGWEGQGCVISQAAASILAEMIKGKSLADLKSLTADKFIAKLEIELSPSRRKCALLPLYAIKEECK